MIKCEKCQSEKTKFSGRIHQEKRYFICLNCGHEFPTNEIKTDPQFNASRGKIPAHFNG